MECTAPTVDANHAISQETTRYLRAPSFVQHEGELELRCRAWNGEEREWQQRWRVEVSPARIDVHELGELSAAIQEDAQRSASSFGEVFIVHAAGITEVQLLRPHLRTLWRGRGTASAPCLVPYDGGVLVAWHHSVREDTGEDDIAKWIALRYVDAHGRVFEPAAAMRDRDRDRSGEEQSFEFPRLVHDGGAIAIFGRGSHNFWRQDLNAAGFGQRVPLGSGEWGSRGRYCAAVHAGTRVLTARRERRAILLETMDLPRGGAPTWKAYAPATLANKAPRRRQRTWSVYFGDIQQHSAHSDGVGSADEAYLRARDRYDDDFVALTDHEAFLGKRTSPSEWNYLQDVADRYDDPGRFATLLAYEWTGKRYPGPGHKCVYLPRRGMRLVSRDTHPEGAQLTREAARTGMLASPHHIGWTGCDADGHDEDAQPVWEICSCHGCYEHADHPLGARGELQDQDALSMLRRGFRFGFSASSDSHGLLWHHGESRKRDPYRTGLTAILAHELTRHAVFEALKARRCYATSGAKILVDVQAEGRPMGSFLATRNAMIEGRAEGISDLARIELVGAKGVIAEGEVEGRRGQLRALVRDEPFAYLRVVQADGEMAWASPFFFTR